MPSPALAGILQALGAGFGGYAQDRQRRAEQDRQKLLDSQGEQRLGLEQQRFGMDQASHQATMDDVKARLGERQAATQRSAAGEQTINDNWEAAIGGDKMAQAKIIAYAPHLANEFNKPAPAPHNPVVGSDEWKAAEQYKASLRPKSEGPAPTIVSAAAPNSDGTPGAPRFFRVPKAGGDATEIGGIVPKTGVSDVAKTAAGYAARMAAAAKTFDAMESNPRFADRLSGIVGSPGGTGALPFVGNFTLDKDMQVYQQKQKDWVKAKLRKESGAVINHTEMADEIKTYFPQPNDSPEVRAAKADSRRIAEEAMRGSAGTATTTPGPRQTLAPPGGGDIDLGAHHVTPAERAALKAQGFTDAQIDAIPP